MKIFYSSEYTAKQKRKLFSSIFGMSIFYFIFRDNIDNFIFYIFFGLNLFLFILSAYHLYKNHTKKPLVEYGEDGVTQFFIHKIHIPFSNIKSIEFSQHRLQFVKNDGTKACSVLKEIVPHKDFDEIVNYFKERVDSEYIA